MTGTNQRRDRRLTWSRVATGVFWLGGAATYAFNKTIEAWFFDHVVHAIAPYEDQVLAALIKFGVPLLLVLAGALVMLETWGKRVSGANVSDELDVTGIVEMPANTIMEQPSEDLAGEAAFSAGFDPGNAATREAALDLLTQRRSEGVKIRNELPTHLSTAELNSWVNRVTTWMNDVVDALKLISGPDSTWFMTLDTVPAARVPIPNIRMGGQGDRELFTSIFRQHDYRLARLDGLLQKYGVGAKSEPAGIHFRTDAIGEYVSLWRGMTKAYGDLREAKSVYASLVDKYGGPNPEGKLDYLARVFATDYSVFGKCLPSDRREQIPKFALKLGRYEARLSRLVHAKNIYEDLEIRTDDLEANIANLARLTANTSI